MSINDWITSDDGTDFVVTPDANGMSIKISRAGRQLGTVIVDSFDGVASALVFREEEEDDPAVRIYLDPNQEPK